MGELSVKDVETRITSYLLELAKGTNTTEIILLPVSTRDLASYFGYDTGNSQ